MRQTATLEGHTVVRRLVALVVSCAVALTGCTSTPKVDSDPELDAAAIVEQALSKELNISEAMLAGRDWSMSQKANISVSADGMQVDMNVETDAQESTADELFAFTVILEVTGLTERTEFSEVQVYLAREDPDYRIYLQSPGEYSRWSQASATEEQLVELMAQYNSQTTTIVDYLEQPEQLGVRAEGDNYVIEAEPAKATLTKILQSQQRSAGMSLTQVKYAFVTWTVDQQTYDTESFSADLQLEVQNSGQTASMKMTVEQSYSYDPVSLRVPEQAQSAPEVDVSELIS